MNREINRLCEAGRYREAIDLALREPCHQCRLFFEIGLALLEEPESERRNAFLTMVIGLLMERGDIEPEHIRPLILALPKREPFCGFADRIAEAVREIMTQREIEAPGVVA